MSPLGGARDAVVFPAQVAGEGFQIENFTKIIILVWVKKNKKDNTML